MSNVLTDLNIAPYSLSYRQAHDERVNPNGFTTSLREIYDLLQSVGKCADGTIVCVHYPDGRVMVEFPYYAGDSFKDFYYRIEDVVDSTITYLRAKQEKEQSRMEDDPQTAEEVILRVLRDEIRNNPRLVSTLRDLVYGAQQEAFTRGLDGNAMRPYNHACILVDDWLLQLR